jgi:L,D-transpeptidase YbiS
MIKPRKVILRLLVGWGAFLVVLELVGLGLEMFRPRGRDKASATRSGESAKEVEAETARLRSRLRGTAPRGIYVLIDTAENRLKVMNGDRVERDVVVSCGSGDILEEPGGKRKWQFDTPRGEFTVTSKLVNPTWIKPDWAFIEEGEKPPAKYDERIDNDSLGDYALGFGDGYFIHGTLYSRLLGRSVTHGCVRVGDKDLQEIFLMVPLGARIFVY